MRYLAEVRPGQYLGWSIRVTCGYFLTTKLSEARTYASSAKLQEGYWDAKGWLDGLPRTCKIIGEIDGTLYRLTKIRKP